MTFAAFVTWNLVFKGVVGGMITGLVAMGIVLVYRSSRVINFAVGNMGVPATALFAVMVGTSGWPYWLSLAIALVIGTLIGALIEVTVIRRLFKAPRVIVLVATIGVAQLCEAVTLALPEYRTGSLQTQFPLPFTGTWHPGLDIEVTASQVLILIIVPLIALGLWWLLGHTAFGDAVRAAATNSDLARMTGINPKMVSTGVWAIAGFLATMAVFLTATDTASADLVHIGPDTLLRGMAAALIGGMVSFPRAMLGGIIIGVLDRVLFFNYTTETGLVQFVLFLAVLVLVAVVSRRDTASAGESFQFAPRIAAVPERLRNIWWVKRMPQFIAGLALAAAVVLPMLSDKSERHQTWTVVIAFALCAVSVVVLTGWGGQLSLGQMAFAGLGALTAAALIRGRVREHRLARHAHHQRQPGRHLLPVGAAHRRELREPRRGAGRRRRAPRARALARGQHARVRRSPRRCISSTGRSSPPASRPCRSRVSTSARSSSRTRTGRTTTSC